MNKVITFGTFDMFHTGHLSILKRARALGDFLVVGVSSDELNIKKKGFLPLFSIDDRLAIIRELRCVDEVFIEYELEYKRDYIIKHSSNILVMGDDWVGRFDEFTDICSVKYLPRTPDISTTAIKERLRRPF